jgi:poly(beta-D-mannuronate) lyase
MSTSSALSVTTETGMPSFECHIKTLDSDGFTITWTINNVNVRDIFYIAFGGDDITNAKVGSFATPTAGSSTPLNQDVTGVGFQPDIIFLLGTNQPQSTLDTNNNTGNSISFSAVKSSSEQALVVNGSRHGLTTSDAARYQRTDKCYAAISQSNATTLESEAAFVATLPNDGFRINWTTISPSTVSTVFYLAIKGGAWKVGNFNHPTGTTPGNQSITGVGFQPKGVIFASTAKPTTTSATAIESNVRLSLGAASASNSQSVISCGERDGVAPTISARGGVPDNTRCIYNIVEDATAANSTISSAASFVSNDAGNGGGFTNNWVTLPADATARQILYVAAGSSQTSSTVSSSAFIFRYHNYKTLTKPAFTLKYHNGGRITPDALHVHRFNILGKVYKVTDFLYRIYNTVVPDITLTSRYGIALASIAVTGITRTFPYNIIQELIAVPITRIFRYDMEPADIHRTGLGKPLVPRIFIYAHNDWQQILVTYNAFRPFETPATTSGLKVSEIDVRLAEDAAGDFSILIEDYGKVLDPTIIGAGNAVLIQAAKFEDQLNDGEHNLIFGFVRHRSVIREDTGTLEYLLEGHGAGVQFNERITNFSYSARRTSVSDPAPDWTDQAMFASNLVKKLVTETDHRPIGFPALPFTVRGVTDRIPKVDDFIPSINEEMTEDANVMNRIADTVSAVWGVKLDSTTGTVDTYFHYPTLEHSGITIKDVMNETESGGAGGSGGGGSEEEEGLQSLSALNANSSGIGVDDLTKTALFIGPWSYTDSISKDDGFTNRFFAKAGTKNSTGNVINISSIGDKFIPLFSNTTPGPDTPGGTGIGGTNIDIVRFPNQATAGVLVMPDWNGVADADFPPLTAEDRDDAYRGVANLQRQHPTVKIIAGQLDSALVDPTGPTFNLNAGASTFLINRIRTLQDGGVTVIGQIDCPPTVSAATAKQVIDQYVNWYNVDGIFFDAVDNVDENLHKAYYRDLAQYCKNTKGLRFVLFETTLAFGWESWYTDIPEVDLIRFIRPGTLPSATTLLNGDPWLTNIPPRRKYISAYNISASTGYTPELIKQWVREIVEAGVVSYFHISRNPDPTLLGKELQPYIGLIMTELENLQQEQPGTPGPPLPIPNPRDLCQSFKPQTTNLTDLMIILSRTGSPTYKGGAISNEGGTSGKNVPDPPNSVHGHIEGSKVISFTETDPNTGIAVTRVTEMPNGEAVGYFSIPFDQIATDKPTHVFLGNVIYKKREIIPNQRYWVVLYGRGQSESQTIRWHQSDNPAPDSLSGERIPGGHDTFQQWTIYESNQSPGFALTFFDTTLQFIEASDSDSIEQFGLVESVIDLSYIPDESLAARFLHAVLNQSSKPKRIYDVTKVTAPDALLVPGKLVSIVDAMSNHPSIGSDVVDAEIVEAGYHFSAEEHPLGCFYVSVKPVGYVDFVYQLWKRKLDQGQIAIPIGEDVIVTPNPPPETTPGGGGSPGTDPEPEPPQPTQCPAGQHRDPVTGQCVPDAPPPPPPAPPDLNTTGILRTRGPYTGSNAINDFLTAVNNAIAGDMIILGNGNYSVSSSADTSFARSGTPTNPIIVRAENVGGVTLTGAAGYTFTDCDNFTWYGFNHRGTANLDVNSCTNFRFSRCDVDLNTGTGSIHWLQLDDVRDSRIDHNYFHDMTTEGAFINVQYPSGNVPTGSHTIIEYNRFQNHTSPASDHGESLIIGVSTNCRTNFRVIFRYNYVTLANGDGETITNKSCCNMYYNNTFFNNNSALTLRHGDSTAVIGNHFDDTGLRIYGADNVISNNHITLNSNDSGDPRGPLTIGIGDVTRPTAQGANYETVDNNDICFNTIHNDTGTFSPIVCWGRTPGGTLDPINNLFRGNIITGQNGMLFDFMNGTGVGSNTFSNNIAWISSNSTYGDITTSMADRENMTTGLTKGTDGIWRISGTGSGAHGHVSTNSNPLSSIAGCNIDIDGETRTGRADAGADHYSTAAAFPTKPKKKITVDDVGPSATTSLGSSPTWEPTS